MASLTHAGQHHRHQPAHSAHGSPPFTAIRFHPLDLSTSATNVNGTSSSSIQPQSLLQSPHHHSLIYAAAAAAPSLLPSLAAIPGASSMLVHAGQPTIQSPLFGPFSAANFAAPFFGHLLHPVTQPHPSLGVIQQTGLASTGNNNSVIEFSVKQPTENNKAIATTAATTIFSAEHSPPQLSLASLSSGSSFCAPDSSDGFRSCSSSSGANSNSAAQLTGNVHQQEIHESAQNGQPKSTEEGEKTTGRKQLVRDEAYWERRRKNNDAAKRSRDSRRKKEDEVAVRAVILEQENLRLRFELERLRTEIERHRIVAFSQGMAAAAVQHGDLTKLDGGPLGLGTAGAGGHQTMAAAAHLAAQFAAAAATMANGRGQSATIPSLIEIASTETTTNG